MNKDLVCRIAGVLLVIISILMLILITNISEFESVTAGFFLGLGLGLLASGEKVLSFWKSIFKNNSAK
jgi:hypothetical protein